MAWSLLLALVALAPDAGATRVAVAPLRGKGGAECAGMLSEMFAERVKIVALDASVEGLTNWDELAEWIEKNGAPEAEVVVVGSLNNSSIVLEAYTTHDKKLVGLKSVETTARCKLDVEGRAVVVDWIDSVVPRPGPPPPPPPLVSQGDAPPPPPPPPEEPPPAPPLAGTSTVQQTTPAAEPAPVRSFAVAIRGGVAIGRRGLSFTGAATPNLRAYEVDVMPLPELSLEAYPFAGADVWEFVRPLGLSASFSRSVGLSSARIEGGPELDTSHSEVSAYLLYRWRVPIASLSFDLIPQVGYHFLSFGLRSKAGGSEPDLPDVGYHSVAFGVSADVPVLERVNLYGGASYLAVLEGGQIFGGGFFEEGKARGYRIEIGMGYEVVDGFIIELAGHHIDYSLSLNAKPTDERVAESAKDTLSGIGLGIRVQL